MGNKFCKVPFQGVCPTNEGYAKGSLDHGKHKDELAHCTRLSWLLPAEGRLLCKVIINKIHQLVNPYNKKKHAVWMILYTGPFGYNGAAPPILDRIADDTPSPLLQPGAVYNS